MELVMAKKKLETLGDLLTQAQIELTVKRGHLVKDAEMARYLDVSNFSFSQWKSGSRTPAGNNLHKLAAKLGPEVYRLTGQPERVPDDPELKILIANWYRLSDEAKEQIRHLINESDDLIPQ